LWKKGKACSGTDGEKKRDGEGMCKVGNLVYLPTSHYFSQEEWALRSKEREIWGNREDEPGEVRTEKRDIDEGKIALPRTTKELNQ